MFLEEEIVRRCAAGDSSAQERLYKHYAPKMLGVCLRYTGSMQEAEDVLQDAFIKVLENIKYFKAEGSLEGWIRRIMVNTALNHHRVNRNLVSQDDVSDFHPAYGEEAIATENLAMDDLLKIIQNLPPGYRMVFNLYEIEGYSHKEISDIMDVSVSTSKSQLMKARLLLRERLSELNKERMKKE